jgi:hypothetical protein
MIQVAYGVTGLWEGEMGVTANGGATEKATA